MGINYFWDSYAIIELIKANPNYLKYDDSPIIITVLNLIEVTNAVYLNFGESKAKEIFEKFNVCVQEISWEDINEAMKLKQKYKKRSLSYADCVGYAYAKNKGLSFLTGDKEFEDLKNVEFVK